MEKLIIKTDSLNKFESVEKFIEHYAVDWMQKEYTNPVFSLGYKLTRIENGYYLEYYIKGSFSKQCARCLEEARKEVNFSATKYFDDETTEVDMDAEAKETIIVEVPENILCSSNCHGICQICGKNKNMNNCDCKMEYTDPRWDKIRDLMKKNNNGGI